MALCDEIKVCHTGEKRMALCDVLALFTTPIHPSIKDSTSTFDGSHRRCSQSDRFHSFKGKKSLALPTSSQINKGATCGTIVLNQSPLAVESHMPFSVV